MSFSKTMRHLALGTVFAGTALAGTAAAYLTLTQKDMSDFALNYHEIDVPQFTDENQLKIAFLADPHIGGSMVSIPDLETVVAQINAENPDIIMIGGDLVLESLKIGMMQGYDIGEIAQTLGGLRARYGVFYINGDHDWRYELEHGRIDGSSEIIDLLRAQGIRALDNANAMIRREDGSVLAVAGTSYLQGPMREDFNQAMQGIDPETPVIFMVHDPRNFLKIPEDQAYNLAYMLAGETHCGQVYGLGRLWVKYRGQIDWPYHGGDFLFRDQVPGYVTCGIGNSFADYRNIKPQAEIITLK